MVHSFGEKSGSVSVLLEKAAQVYFEKALRQLYLFTILPQPWLIIVLGIRVTRFIFVVYMPMMDLAHAMR